MDDDEEKNFYKIKNVCIIECIYHYLQLFKYEGIDFKTVIDNQEKLNQIISVLKIEKQRALQNINNIKNKIKYIYDKYCYKKEAKTVQFNIKKEDIQISSIQNYYFVGNFYYDNNMLNYFFYIKYIISYSPWNIFKDYVNTSNVSKKENQNDDNKKKKKNKKYQNIKNEKKIV